MEETGEIVVLRQCLSATWDGNLASKSARDKLEAAGYIVRCHGGYQIATDKGVKLALDLGVLKQP
jgi:hypothetical protein